MTDKERVTQWMGDRRRANYPVLFDAAVEMLAEVRADERERCAKVAQNNCCSDDCDCIAAIRALE